ncbi:hypothetical protein POX_h09891 [Penicillium oxalicum]|uniref:hypothetical protein n=1 Tax=Penicillium oxalicum TaxID=69781 RepID=UPI0020B85226|nr:hypothetical protein POX_h09891 [Penicillium oxalicum]KAI2786123.1 hypothetical protein POX_h09891 [Penicillium oxalicum]
MALSWIITKKLSLRIRQLSQQEVDLGYGLPMIIGKFLCHLEGDPTREAFLRMYYQIPIIGTEDADLATLTEQIRPRKVPGECEAYRRMMSRECRSVPRFYGYSQNQQEGHDYVPGGLIEYLAWEKVPGEPLTEDLFWSLDRRTRDDIRGRFRAAYEEVIQCEVEPDTASISKIIYNQSTGDVYISGFRGAWPVRDELNWSDTFYVLYGLAKPHDDRHWPSCPGKWEY